MLASSLPHRCLLQCYSLSSQATYGRMLLLLTQQAPAVQLL
jgi:hypothetical protein